MAKPVKPKDLKPKSTDVSAEAVTPVATDGATGDNTANNTNQQPVTAKGGGGLDLKFIITLVVVLISTTVTSLASVYFIAPMVLVPAIVAKLPPPGEAVAAEGEDEDGHETKSEGPKLGLSFPLDEFTANLKDDPELGGTQYVKTKMALSIGVPKSEDCIALKEEAEHAAHKKEGAEGGGHGEAPKAEGGGHGEATAPAKPTEDPCITSFSTNMAPFVPTIRDIINGSLMAHTAEEPSQSQGPREI
jgi:flagellar basal body-associated protein FliL